MRFRVESDIVGCIRFRVWGSLMARVVLSFVGSHDVSAV